MLKIWGRQNSHNVKKLMWLVHELELDHVREEMGGDFGYTDSYLSVNPNRLVPAIEDGDLVLWESNAILRYLSARHSAHFWSPDPAKRAVGDKWMDWQLTYADAQREAFVQLVRVQPERRDEAAIARSAKRCGEMMAVLDAALERAPWLAGDAFGLGDIPMGVYVHTFLTLGLGSHPLPHVNDWHARLRARPAYVQTILVPLS